MTLNRIVNRMADTFSDSWLFGGLFWYTPLSDILIRIHWLRTKKERTRKWITEIRLEKSIEAPEGRTTSKVFIVTSQKPKKVETTMEDEYGRKTTFKWWDWGPDPHFELPEASKGQMN